MLHAPPDGEPVKPVMAGDHMKRHYAERFGIETIVPAEDEQVEIDRIIFGELCRGTIDAGSKARYLEIVDRLMGEGAEGVILGCTEIPLLIGQSDRPDVPMFDTTALHVDAAVRMALDGEAGLD